MIQVLLEKPINKLSKFLLKFVKKNNKYTIRKATDEGVILYKINCVLDNGVYYITGSLFRTNRKVIDALSQINQYTKVYKPDVIINLVNNDKDSDNIAFLRNKERWRKSFKNIIIN